MTLVLLVGVVIAAWPEIVKAWGLLDRVNLWVLSLLIPVQLVSYWATGGIIFSYLRAKRNLSDMSHFGMMRLALELNFVNHVLPSGGAAGFSYLAWALRRHGVSVARSTMAQIVRFALTFISFAVLMIVSVVWLALSDHIERATVFISLATLVAVIISTVGLIWLVQSRSRLDAFSRWLERTANRIVSFVTRGKRQAALHTQILTDFFDGLHDDYVAIRKERRILVRPFVWSVFANALDAVLLYIAFLSLGFSIDIGLLFIAYGIASVAGAVSFTPGGAGVYEAAMVLFLSAGGVAPDVAIAGTLLARVILVLGTIVFGYIFYQATILRFGEAPSSVDEVK